MEKLCRKAPRWPPRHHRATAGQEILVQDPEDRSSVALPRNSGLGENTSGGNRSCFLSLVEFEEGSSQRKAGRGVCWVSTIFMASPQKTVTQRTTSRPGSTALGSMGIGTGAPLRKSAPDGSAGD